MAQVWVSVNGAAQKLLVCKSQLVQSYPWIAARSTYTFNLYKTAACTDDIAGKTPDASVTVTGVNGTSASAAEPLSQYASVLTALQSILAQLRGLVPLP